MLAAQQNISRPPQKHKQQGRLLPQQNLSKNTSYKETSQRRYLSIGLAHLKLHYAAALAEHARIRLGDAFKQMIQSNVIWAINTQPEKRRSVAATELSYRATFVPGLTSYMCESMTASLPLSIRVHMHASFVVQWANSHTSPDHYMKSMSRWVTLS